MKNLLLTLFLAVNAFSFSQISVVSWNIQYMGSSKDSIEIAYIAKTIKNYDVIAIQEIVTSSYGEDAILRLVNSLDNVDGCCWSYVISDKTNGDGTEKYAFVYNKEKVEVIGNPFLESSLDLEIDREPFIGTFASKNRDTITIVNFHAVPTSKDPENEIKHLHKLDIKYKNYPLLFLGDFNLSQTDYAYNELKSRGYAASLIGQKTSLKRYCTSTCLSEEYDNFFYNTSKINPYKSYLIHFYEDFENLSQAKKISDHCPIVIEFETFK